MPPRSLAEDGEEEDVDRGWAWVVAGAATLSLFLILGLATTFSVYFVVFLEAFQEGKGFTAWIGSINYGMLCAVGPVASILLITFGCRATVFAGSVLSSLGIILSACAPNVLTLCITFGVIAGTGYGFIFTACIVVVTEHFSRLRVFIIGLSLAAGSLGTMAFPWLTRELVETYGWRGALVISGGINLNVCVAALLMRPRIYKWTSNPCSKRKAPIQKQTDGEERAVQAPLAVGKTRLYLKLFKRPKFMLLCINVFLYSVSMSVLFTHIASYAEHLNFSESRRIILVSVLGMAGFAGRIILGALGLLRCLNTKWLYCGSCFLAGLASISIGSWRSFAGLVTGLMGYGFFAATYGPQLSEMTYVASGGDHFATGYGYVMFFSALGQIFGAPIAGFLYDATLNYPASFYLAGVSLVLSAAILVFVSFEESAQCVTTVEVEETAVK